jgi:hypothetical protein
MALYNINTKRQILTALLSGRTDALRKYQRQQTVSKFPFQWVIDARDTGEGITTIDKQGINTRISEQEFDQLPPQSPIWRIVDYTGGQIPPGIDE